MESRPEDKPTDVDNAQNLLATLVPELQLKIFRKLTLSEVGKMQQSSQFFKRLLQDDKFWMKKHNKNKQFNPTPIEGENQRQYYAELLYQNASEQIRPDKKQIAMLKLHRFLKTQKHQWKNYYCGLIFFNGLGTKVSHDIGFMKLIDALDMHDYRAAIIIERILATTKDTDPTLSNQFASLLGEQRLELMYELILHAKMRELPYIDTEDHFENEGISIRALFDIDLHITTLNTAIEHFQYLAKSLFEIASRVSAYFRDQMELDMEEIAGDPEMVWWVLLAAQAGCTTSLNDLQSLENVKDYPFVCYALAVIYKFGILHSTEIEPNHDKAEYYFHLAQNRNLEEYVLTGQGKDFACEETIDFLRTKMNASPPRSEPRPPGSAPNVAYHR